MMSAVPAEPAEPRAIIAPSNDDPSAPGSGQATPHLLKVLIAGSQEMIGAVDQNFRLIFANPAYQASLQSFFGKEIGIGAALETFVDGADIQAVRSLLERVLQGEVISVVHRLGDPRRQAMVCDVRLYPLLEDELISGVGYIVSDVTARVARHARERFLSELESAIRLLSDTDEIRRHAVRLLGEHLRVNRCVYADIKVDQHHSHLAGNYVQDVGDAQRQYRFDDFGIEARRSLIAGEPLIVENCETDQGLSDRERQHYRALEMLAVLAIPLRREGRSLAFLAVHSKVPRQWQADEVELLKAVVGRCWESMERARAETDLRLREARLLALVQGSAQIVWAANRQGLVTEDSPSWRAFTGQSVEQWLGSGWTDAVHPEDWAISRKLWADAFARSAPIETEYRIRHFSGDWRWTSVRVQPVFNADGSVREWVGMNSDITRRKQTERRDAFLVQMDDGVRRLADPDEIALTAVQRLCDQVGADRASYFEVEEDQVHCTRIQDYAPGRESVRERYSLDDYGSAISDSLRANRDFVCNDLTQAELSQAERVHYTRLQIGALINLPLHKNGRLVAIVGLYQTLPRRWQPDEIELAHLVASRCWESIERARVTRELLLADRRKDEFLATLAHELRNPLAPLRNALDIIKLAPPDFPPQAMYSLMERQVDHLMHLVDDLLDVSRVNSGKIDLRLEPVLLAEVLSAAVETARPMIESSRHQLSLDITAEPLCMSADPMRMTQIITNLLNNAAKFTEDGGQIHLSLQRDKEQAVISVRDNGIGVAPEMRERVFDIFTQVSRGARQDHGGLGIGLSLVRSLAQLHGGSVEVHSEGLGKGSEFTVRLPVVVAAPAPARKAEAAWASAAAVRILVVDDNCDAADAIAMLLTMLGAEVETAYRAEDALEALDRHQPTIAFLDIGMPHMDGYELARQIRRKAHGADLHLIALTGWGQPSDRLLSREAGFDHHLVKPVDMQALRAVLALLQPA